MRPSEENLKKMADNKPFIGGVNIKPSPTADTRTAKESVKEEVLLDSSKKHIADVKLLGHLLAHNLQLRIAEHDVTKILKIGAFYDQFHEAQETGKWSESPEYWYKKWHLLERHHLKDRIPEDVDLLDVLEMICDNVAAGLARSGEYRKEEMDMEVLKKAFDNTVKKLVDCCIVEKKGGQ